MIPFAAASLGRSAAAGGGGGGEGPTPALAATGASWFSGTVNATFNTAYPASGIAAGNIAIIFLTGWNLAATSPTWTIAAPAGWNLLAGPINTESLSVSVSGRIYAFWRRLDGSESGSVNITSSATVRFKTGRMAVFSGCAASGTPFEGLGTNANVTTGTNDPQGSSIAATGNNRLALCYIGVDDKTAGMAVAADWTQIWDVLDTSGSNTHTELASKAIGLGTEPAHDPANLTAVEAWGSISLALLPEPA